jgi:hypothetical protein
LGAGCAADNVPPDKTGDGGGGGTQTDGSDPPPPATDSAQFLMDYASSVCEMYEPCCQSAGLGYARGGCSEWFRKVTAVYFRGDYKPDAASVCLQHLAEVRAADSQRCGNVLDFDEATLRTECQRAFGAAERSGAPLGGKCLLAGDCASASAEDGAVICYSGNCLLQRQGKDGDGPCFFGGTSGIKGVPDESFQCNAKDGVYCDRVNNVCAATVADGEGCPTGAACKPTAICTGGRCVTLPGEGETCLNAIPGAGGFCRPGSSCDVATLTCSAPLKEGATCREPAQCESRSCMSSKCTKPEFTRALNCTGK